MLGRTVFLNREGGKGWGGINWEIRIDIWASPVAHTVKHLPTMWETQVWSLGQEDPLEKEMATDSSSLASKIPWTEECDRLVHGVAKSWTWQSDFTFTFIKSHSRSSICDRKVTGDEGPNGDEWELRQVPEGWKWVIAVKACCLKLGEFFCVGVYLYVRYFSLLEISFPLFAVDRCSLSFEALFQCYKVSEVFLVLLSWCY